MKKIIGFIIILFMIPVIISVIGDIDRKPIYPTTEFSIIDKPSEKQLLSNDKLLYQLPNTIYSTTNELPEYFENGTIDVDSGILNYTIDEETEETTITIYFEFLTDDDNDYIYTLDEPYLLFDMAYLLTNGFTITKLYDNENGINITINDLIFTDDGLILFDDNSIRYEILTSTYNILINKTYDSIYSVNAENLISLVVTFSKFNITYIVDYIEADFTQVVDGELIFSKPTKIISNGDIYDLGEGVELYKLPNGVGDIWYQNGTLERNVGIIDTVNNYAEFGTLSVGTYENILEFINNNQNQNQNIKIFYDDIIQEGEYNIYLENDIIIISNDIEFIRIYNNDTYTSTRNLDTNINYKLEGFNIIDYIESEFDDAIIRLFWVIPVLLAGLLIYLIFKRKE